MKVCLLAGTGLMKCCMKVSALTLLLITACVLPAQARLGETEKLLINRYGDEISNQWSDIGHGVRVKELKFKKTGFEIDVFLFNGLSAKETFTKMTSAPLNQDDRQTLLQANSQDHRWTNIQNGVVKSWRRDDGAFAYFTPPNRLYVQSKELSDTLRAAAKTANESSLGGF